MAADIALVVMTPAMRPGHLVSLLRNAPDSPFFDHDDADLRTLNDAAEEAARKAHGPDDTFQDVSGTTLPGVATRAVHSMSTRMQATIMSKRLRIAAHEDLELLDVVDNGVLDMVHQPTLVAGHLRAAILEAIQITGGDQAAATAFLDQHHGMTAVVVFE